VDERTLRRTLRLLAPSSLASIGAVPESVLELARAAQIPVAIGDVLVSDESRMASIGQAQEDVGYAQFAYLAAKGHEQIAYLLPDDDSLSGFASHRFIGARRAQEQLGLPKFRHARRPISRSKLTALAKTWANAGITAVCAYNDDWALPLLGCMHDLGLHAPDDLAVIGVDDIPAAAFSIPPLTTMHHDMQVAAMRSIAVLDVAAGRIAEMPEPERPFSTLVERVSA
jgi:DNA-binding LacI/PurR family transcriptional regulator